MTSAWQHGFIAVDWGTTNRRAYRIDAAGRCTDRFEDGRGVLSVVDNDFAGAVVEIARQLGDEPMLLAGMVGSNRGWSDAGYVAAPAGLADLAAALHWVVPGRAAIVPGVSLVDDVRCDVMRGEEVQALGAVVAGMIPPDVLLCHPGTHTKWIMLTGGQVTGFRTAMTGELFALLKDHSILSGQLQAPAGVGPAFCDGVDVALSGEPLLATLFGVRSAMLLGRLPDEDAASYASGLLIGSDVAAHCKPGSGPVALIGRPELCTLYAAALERAGHSPSVGDGAQAFVAGMTAIWRTLR